MPRTQRKDDALLGEAEVQRLLLAASERAPTGVRNRALIAFLYCSGLRLGEALRVKPEELDLAAASVHVRGPRARAAHVFPAANPYLETWLALRVELAPAARAPLFCTLKGEPLEPAYVRAMLARLGKRAGLASRVHAHGLRHACAARLGRSGLAAEALAEQLGHRRTRSTRRSLAGFGVSLSASGTRDPRTLAWSLAPEPGAVRALVSSPKRKTRPARGRGGVVVRRWRPDEL